MTFGGLGRPWKTLEGLGKPGLGGPWKALQGLGRPWKALKALEGLGKPSTSLEGLGRPWKALEGLGKCCRGYYPGRPWKALEGLGRPWKALEGLGRPWKALEGPGKNARGVWQLCISKSFYQAYTLFVLSAQALHAPCCTSNIRIVQISVQPCATSFFLLEVQVVQPHRICTKAQFGLLLCEAGGS